MLGVGRDGPTGPRLVSDAAGRYEAATGRDRTATGSAGPDRDALAVVASVDGVGPTTLDRLLAAFGGPAEVLEAARTSNGAAAIRAATRRPDERWPSMTARAAEAMVAAAREPGPILDSFAAAGVHPLILEDPGYPERLRQIALPPRVLFVRGADAALESVNAVAVVGTRRPTDEGRRTATRIGAALARAGALVVSGLALGIDGAAHAAVLGQSGRTVAVIGGGHDRLTPTTHDRLAAAIVAGGGAVISEHAPGVAPSAGTFPRRNRVISGLADAVVVVEAGARSGALVTAAWALEQGRECFLVPGSIDAPQSAGCLAWLRDYAGLARIVAGVPQLLEDLGLEALAAFPGPVDPVMTDGRGGPTRSVRAASRDADGGPEEGARPGPRPCDGPGSGLRPGGALRPEAPPRRRPSVEALTLDLPEREGRLLLALERGATTVDELAAVARLTVAAVLAGLTGLEERGLVDEQYGRYRLPAEILGRAWPMVDPAA